MTSTRSAHARTSHRTSEPTLSRRRRAMRWVGAFVVALLWVSVMTAAQYAGAPVWAVAVLMATPAAATLAVQRATWAQARRWCVVLALAVVVDQYLLSLYLLVALTWALHRSWVSDRAPFRFAKETPRGH